MPSAIVAVDVVVAPSPVVDVYDMSGPPGPAGPAGPAGAPGPPGPAGPAGADALGDVTGPASATDNALAVFSGTTGKLVKDAVGAAALGRINALAVGTNPAQSGAVRLANNQAITARNAANSADLTLLRADATNNVSVGSLAVGDTFVDAAGGILLRPNGGGNVNYNVDGAGIYPGFNDARQVGHPNLRFQHLNLSRTINLAESAAPAAPAADCVNLWAEDNGAGKTRLMVQFATGAAIQIAIQP